ncbi:hypothetical protein CDL15_Pgr011212 [Punica granatum]|uniref:Uncharacterized protein n=1 Tax=Punica granatum TaxID=22663 RepID=A0A218WE38_PUNGR|nr:hypothetical protein CDL15_Pgr011212 [Punica granatum]
MEKTFDGGYGNLKKIGFGDDNVVCVDGELIVTVPNGEEEQKEGLEDDGYENEKIIIGISLVVALIPCV